MVAVGEEAVRLRLGHEDVLIAEHYDVRMGVFKTPNTFAVRLGDGSSAAKLMAKYPPRTPFELSVGDQLIMIGAIDGYSVAEGEGGTSVTFEGSDDMALLCDTFVDAERTYKDASIAELARSILDDLKIPRKILITDDEATSARAVTQQHDRRPGKADKYFTTTVRARIGETRYQFLHRHFAEYGLFMRANNAGQFLLTVPNAKQAPTYKIVRTPERSNARLVSFRNTTKPPRYARCEVHSRAMGVRCKRPQFMGSAVDAEMQKLGFDRVVTMRDVDVQSPFQAALLAERHLTEARRASWELVYGLAGHIDPTSLTLWMPDSVVRVQDQLLGLDEDMWIESVVHARGPDTTTNIHLMRVDDVAFDGT